MKKNNLKGLAARACCGLLAAVMTFGAFGAIPVRADEYDDWDDWDVYWDDDDDDLIDLIIIDSIIEEAENERRKEEQRRRDEENRRRQEEERRKEEQRRREEAERNRYIAVNGIRVSTNSVSLAVGGTTQVGVQVQPENASNRGVTLTSSNPAVATVDIYANIRAVAPGSAVITARTNENGYTATINVSVAGAPAAAPAAAPATASRNAAYCSAAAAQILAAPPAGIVNLASMTPMSFNAEVANAMAVRPDVTVATAFPYQGHTYMMTLTAGYNLAARLDKSGYVDWTTLFALRTSDPRIVVVAVN